MTDNPLSVDGVRLSALAQEYGLTLTPEQTDLLVLYAQKMLETNRVMNLTAITDPREVEQKHLLDSLLAAALPEMAGSVLDVGTGAGFPGVAVKLYRPELELTLLDATEKKLRFVAGACEELGIELKTLHGRAEEMARGPLRARFDTVVARAVAALPALCEYCIPYLKIGGCFVAMKGADSEKELADAKRAIALLGGRFKRTESHALPGGDRRTLIIIEKISQTPTAYPRKGKNIKNSPII